MNSVPVRAVGPRVEPLAAGLIQAYGLFWSLKDLRALGYRLYGESGDGRVADFKEQNGLYVLYGSRGVQNIGIATKKSLASRLKTHDLNDRQVGLWTRFSWFGFRDAMRIPDRSGWAVLEAVDTEDFLSAMRPKDAIKDLEALLIFVQSKDEYRNPLQLRPKFRRARLWKQIPANKKESKVSAARVQIAQSVTPLAKGDPVVSKHGPGVIVGRFGSSKYRVRDERDGRIHLVSGHSLKPHHAGRVDSERSGR